MITQIISQMFSLSQVSEASISTSAVCAAPHMDMAKMVCQPDTLFVLLVAQRATRSKAKGFPKLTFQASLMYTHFLAHLKHIPEHTDPLRFLHWGSKSTG